MNNNREKLLLVVFVSALLIAGGVFAWKWLAHDLQTRRDLLAGKETQLAELRGWLDQKTMWENREKWMADHPLPPYQKQHSEAEFVQTIQGSLTKSGIQTVDQRIQETRDGSVFVEVPIDLTLDATLEQLVRWLYDVQRPEGFRVVSQIRLHSSGDSAKIRAEVSLFQIFAQNK
jgi:hypothetical protein